MAINNQDLSYYQQEELWEHYANMDQLIVAKDIVSMIPKQVKTVLDVGCGKGTVTNIVSESFSIVGADISLEALKHVKPPAVQSDICCLPFENDSFDLVLASDIIEHIPEKSYKLALSELLRVSKKFILISVPYMEILEALFTTCSECGFSFHVNWHQRSYDAHAIDSLFAQQAGLIKYKLSGPTWAWSDKFIVKLKNSYLGCHFNHNHAVCPQCHTSQKTKEEEIISFNKRLFIERSLESLQYKLIEKDIIKRPEPCEIVALYDKKAKQRLKVVSQPEPLEKEVTITLKLEKIPKVTYIPNYPTGYLVSGIEPTSWVLVLPTNFNKLSFTRTKEGDNILVEMYDSPHEKYYPLYQYANDTFLCGHFSPSIKGYFIKFNCPLDAIDEITLSQELT